MGETNVIFDGPPGPEGRPRFIEVEDEHGNSITCSWRQRPDGLWALVIPSDYDEGYQAGFNQCVQDEEDVLNG